MSHLLKMPGVARLTLWIGCWTLMGLFPSARADEARIPPLAFLSNRLYQDDRAVFAQRRQVLFTRLGKFQAAARAFNAKAAEAQTDEEFNAVQGMRRDYIMAAEAFNREVEAAEVVAVRRADLPAARVAAARGEYYFVTKDGHKLTGAEATTLVLDGGTRVVVSPGGSLQFLLPDETVFTLGPGSDMVIDEFVYDPAASSTRLTAQIARGAFRFVTGKISHRKDINIKVPVGTIGVRGTDFEAVVESDGAGTVKLFDGQLDITEKKTGRQFSLTAGQMVTFTADGSFSQPALLPP
jgi:hypothetical protein